MIQLFALVAGLRALPTGEELEQVAVAGLDAVIGPAPGDEHGDVVRHGLVVEALVELADAVLPARFGERFRDLAALEQALAPRAPALRHRLAEVEGCVEIAVRVGRPGRDEPVSAPSGGSYMRARLQAASADAAEADALHEALRRRSRAAVVGDGATARLLHDASYLVERGGVDDFARSVQAYADAHPELDLVCTGPWAPSSFAGAA